MNKIILALLLTIALAAPANAQNCVNSSRCDELGYTKTIADCNGLDILKCPFDSNKVFCSSAGAQEACRIGDILYSDMSCSPAAISGKTPIGIIFAPERRLAVALDGTMRMWGNSTKKIGSAAQGDSGKSNTAAILAYGKANKIKYPAAEYCNSYSTIATKAGDWFLPSIEELTLLFNNFVVINSALKVLGKPTITVAEYEKYWSSSESYTSFASGMVPSSGDIKSVYKESIINVRPVLAF